jgi:uncharacterized protein
MSPQLRVRVHPGARRAGVTGRLADGTWKLAVPEPPEDGRANRGVETLLARTLGVPRTQVTVVRGAGSRSKVIEVQGLADEEITRRLEGAREDGEPDAG